MIRHLLALKIQQKTYLYIKTNKYYLAIRSLDIYFVIQNSNQNIIKRDICYSLFRQISLYKLFFPNKINNCSVNLTIFMQLTVLSTFTLDLKFLITAVDILQKIFL